MKSLRSLDSGGNQPDNDKETGNSVSKSSDLVNHQCFVNLIVFGSCGYCLLVCTVCVVCYCMLCFVCYCYCIV